MTQLASYQSRGGKWIAELSAVEGGYQIREFKNGNSCGSAFRPHGMIATDDAAVAWADQHVRDCFDVRMTRCTLTGIDGI